MRGTILVVPIIRTIVFWGLYWGPLILGNYHLSEVHIYTLILVISFTPHPLSAPGNKVLRPTQEGAVPIWNISLHGGRAKVSLRMGTPHVKPE